MMTTPALIQSLVMSVPMVGALMCFTVTALDSARPLEPVRRRIHREAMEAYGVFAVCWFLVVTRTVFPGFHALTLPLFVPAAMLAYVLLYRMIRTATDMGDGGGRIATREHVAFPVLIFSVMGALWLALPADHISRIVHTSAATNPFAWFVTAVCLAYAVVYPAMGIVRIGRYRRSRPSRSSHDRVLARLWWGLLVEMVVMPVPIFGFLLGVEPFAGAGLWLLLAVLPSRVIYSVSCFDLLSDNYMVIAPEPASSAPRSDAPPIPRLNRERVDLYIETKKPWLNPGFRIGDMAEDLFSNRAYVSAFINSEYGINFNRFVNGHRLGEVERLKAEAKRKKQRVPMLQLILNAGFSSYRSYLRAKEALTRPLDGDENEAV